MHPIFSAITIIAFSMTNAPPAAPAEDGPPDVIKSVLPSKVELPKMVTDRPDYTESTDVVGEGVIQVEDGFTVERGHGGTSLAAPELLMRLGLTKRLEFRLGGDGFLSRQMPGEENVVGHSDIELGAKILLFEQGRNRPALSLIPILSLPLGSPGFSSEDYDPTLKVALGKDLPKGFSVGGNVNFSSVTTPDGRFLQTAFSASFAHRLGHGYGGYWEIFGFTPWEKGGSAAWIANTGLTRSLGKNAQVDVRVGKRLTDCGPGWFWGIGIAFRQRGWPSLRSILPTAVRVPENAVQFLWRGTNPSQSGDRK